MAQHTDYTEVNYGVPLPLALVQKHGISLRMIARACNVCDATVRHVMDPAKAMHVKHLTLMQIRRKVEGMLTVFGEEYTPEQLWREYDEKVAA